jgi:hypothetical protein
MRVSASTLVGRPACRQNRACLLARWLLAARPIQKSQTKPAALPSPRTTGHVVGGIGRPPRFCSKPATTRSSSAGIVAAGATMQKPAGVRAASSRSSDRRDQTRRVARARSRCALGARCRGGSRLGSSFPRCAGRPSWAATCSSAREYRAAATSAIELGQHAVALRLTGR